MLKGIFLILAAIVAAAPAMAEDDVERAILDKAMETCARDKSDSCAGAFVEACSERGNWTTVSMMICEGLVGEYWDRTVDQLAADIAATGDGAFQADVRMSQARWRAYRSATCGLYRHFLGTIHHIEAALCHSEVTRRRVRFLEDIRAVDPLNINRDAAPGPIPDNGVTHWRRRDALSVDLDCDGLIDRVTPGLRAVTLDDGGPGLEVVLRVGDPASGEALTADVTLPVDETVQAGVCAPDVSLTVEPGPANACPVLRIDDGACDALFVRRDRGLAVWVLERN